MKVSYTQWCHTLMNTVMKGSHVFFLIADIGLSLHSLAKVPAKGAQFGQALAIIKPAMPCKLVLQIWHKVEVLLKSSTLKESPSSLQIGHRSQ